jgi:hypothetical protein
MNPEIKAQWVAALRSGEFEQGKGTLKRDGKFCCLGVLCELAARAGVVTAAQDRGITRYGTGLEHGTGIADSGTLPPSVRHWAEVDSHNPNLIPNNHESAAAYLNDGGVPFAHIADLIEYHL